MPSHLLTMAVIYMQINDFKTAKTYFNQLEPQNLEQRAYLYYSAKADYYAGTNQLNKALAQIDLALEMVNNNSEKAYLTAKRSTWREK